MRNIRNRRVVKLTVKDLKEQLKDADDDAEVVLGFYLKDKPNHFVYLAEVMTNLNYDGVIKERLFNTNVVELCGYDHEYCSYQSRKDE